ncbi:MAG: M48 family metallopeptidase [Nitrospirae bacterium]|nr:M48 family metallopeptidase [Nitrospirota bacterium]MDA1304441.1 M48 family metallopeptidase [Nitrospirota bacterium]
MTASSTWHGQYFDGHSPIAHQVFIVMAPVGLTIHGISEQPLLWAYADIHQTQGNYAGEEVRLERKNAHHDLLVVQDAKFLTALHGLAPNDVRHLHNPRTRTRRLWLTIAAGVFAIPLIWIVYAKGVPALSGPLTTLIPYSWETHLGDALVEEIAPSEARCLDPQLLEKANSLIQALVSTVETVPYTFRLAIVDQPILNAMALPGGHIIIFRGLLENTETPEELTGVLAHEIQHVLQRHGMRLLVQNMTLGLIIGALTGDISGIMTFVLEGAHVLQTLSYSRSAEEEADREGMGLLLAAKINPEGMLSFFEYLKEQHGEKNFDPMWRYLSTHPTAGDRVDILRKQAHATEQPSHSLFPLDDWQQITHRCHGDDGKNGKIE